ncbi:MAG: hypothetical protein Q8K99_14900 [Actinomycetota bacterium]|nr:hypothetical protein [Actinomycetota bacterium]
MDRGTTTMSRRILQWAVVVVLVVALVAPFALRYYRKQEARRVISRYAVLLSEGLENLTPEIVGEVASAEEVSRVGTYSTRLWGNNIRLESDLLELQILEVVSQEPTVTVKVKERWRYVERDRKSGAALGEEREETQLLDYTLVRANGKLIVYRSDLLPVPEGSTN